MAERDGSTLISVNAVDKIYTRGGEEVHVLNRLSMEVRGGEFLALMGPSGCGKSTLLNLIGAIDHVDSGNINFDGQDLEELSEAERANWRARNIGFIFQAYNLIPVLTALQNVLLPLLLAPISKKRRREQAELALQIVGMSDRIGHYPNQLSGGQEQRVAIARAIATDPRVLLADEPTGDLDATNATSILELMKRLNKENGQTIVMVTHDPRAAECADRTLHLDKGSVVTIGGRS